MASRYVLQIVDRATNEVAQWEPGRTIELEFVDYCVTRITEMGDFKRLSASFIDDCVGEISARGVGLGRTTRRVEAAVRRGIQAVLDGEDPNNENHKSAVRRGIEDAIHLLKLKVRT